MGHWGSRMGGARGGCCVNTGKYKGIHFDHSSGNENYIWVSGRVDGVCVCGGGGMPLPSKAL